MIFTKQSSKISILFRYNLILRYNLKKPLSYFLELNTNLVKMLFFVLSLVLFFRFLNSVQVIYCYSDYFEWKTKFVWKLELGLSKININLCLRIDKWFIKFRIKPWEENGCFFFIQLSIFGQKHPNALG